MKPSIHEMHFLIPSRLDALGRVERIVRKISAQMGLNKDERDNLAISVTEAVGNAIIHGNKKDPEKNVKVDVLLGDGRVQVTVTDQGTGFNPSTLNDPLAPQNLMKEHGRGIFILKSLMDEVDFDFSADGTSIRMVLVKKDPAA